MSIFKKRILSFTRPLLNKISNHHFPQGLKLLTRLGLGLHYLRYHKFKIVFWLPSNPLSHRNTLLNKISEINSELVTRNYLVLIETLLFGDNSSSQYDNSRILDATIAFTVTSKRFDKPILV